MGDFEEFDVTDAKYKSADNLEIGVTFLTRKGLPGGRYPVIVRFHGGFLMTGGRMTADWFPQWVLDLALQQNAILVTPDYRLMPEASGTDILTDVASLFTWLRAELPFKLSGMGIEADLSNILTCGESAGGYLAVQAALLLPDAGIRAVISQYGVLDIKTKFFLEDYEKRMVGRDMFDASIVEDHVRAVRAGEGPRVVTAAEPPDRISLAIGAVQHGRFAEFLGSESRLYPMENLDARADGEVPVPAMWILHGRDDTAVPVDGSRAFAEKLKTLHPSTDLHLTIEPGEHGFDRTTPMDEPWLREGLEFISKHWP